jgi:peptidoglycan hydrolase-like amidase
MLRMPFFRKFSFFVFFTFLVAGILMFKPMFYVSADICDSAESCGIEIEKLSKDLEASKNATAPLEEELKSLEARINSAKAGIARARNEAAALAVSISEREEALVYHYQIFSNRVAESYKRARTFNPLSLFLSSQSANQLTKDLAYQESARAQDDRLIRSLSEEINKLNEDKQKLESDQVRLAALSEQLDEQADFFKGEVAKAKSYQSELSGKIAALSAKQQSILSEKSGTFQTTVGDVPLADDAASRPDYNPGFSPAFAVFSFGAPHFKGMSQYGALGRAKSGQNYEAILKAYYGGGIEIKDHNPDQTITVDGYGQYSLEEYTKRIYEMPGSWGDQGGMEALKAQAVAARSYVLARGGTICATEACQVFKPEAKGGNWEKAVNETRGKVVYANGQPFSTWYASTSGGYQESYSANGYSTPGFWDTANGRDGWTSQAYEKIAGSPWFYKAWYKTRSGDSCGRSNPWLNSEEMADILNAWVVMYQGSGDSSRVTPESSCWGGNPYSKSELAGIGGFNSVSGVSVQYSDSGVTANVTFQTNKGSVTINGNEFYKSFNLRAPARVSVKSGLFNIEKK